MANISCNDIVKSYGGHPVIEGLDLDIPDHEFVVFLGPSGCGKSTMLRMIAGLEEVTGGRIAIGGTDVTDLPPGERGVAMSTNASTTSAAPSASPAPNVASSGRSHTSTAALAGTPSAMPTLTVSGFVNAKPAVTLRLKSSAAAPCAASGSQGKPAPATSVGAAAAASGRS